MLCCIMFFFFFAWYAVLLYSICMRRGCIRACMHVLVRVYMYIHIHICINKININNYIIK